MLFSVHIGCHENGKRAVRIRFAKLAKGLSSTSSADGEIDATEIAGTDKIKKKKGKHKLEKVAILSHVLWFLLWSLTQARLKLQRIQNAFTLGLAAGNVC